MTIDIDAVLRRQHELYAQRLRDNQCVSCGAAFIGGEPPHQVDIADTLGSRVELWCADCIEESSSACWNDEAWGPYPARIRHRPGPEKSDS
ncbi:MAG: hypothetical protein WAK41_03175 [Roseiarcus sp.]|uniref:hypothetical protein n=1 Tax=Roseiarcus sp. TaxID=1969460 RepID=UPI003BB019A1